MGRIRDVLKYPASLTEVLISVILLLSETKPLQPFVAGLRWLYRQVFWFLPLFPGSDLARESEDTLAFNSLFRAQLPRFGIAFLFTLFMCLIVTGILAYLDGRFFPADAPAPGTTPLYNYLDDLPNILLYAAVTPAYIALGTVILSLSWSFQRQITARKTGVGTKPRRVIDGTRPDFAQGSRQMTFWITAALVFCAGLSAFYQIDVYDLLVNIGVNFSADENSPKTRLIYWFLEQRGGDVSYNLSGYYYIALNIGLFIFTVVAVLAFLSAAFSAMSLTYRIRNGEYDSFAEIGIDLRRFTLSFVFAKWLFLAYIVNTFIWRESYLKDVANLDVTIIAYSIIGSLFLPIPAMVIQSVWYTRERSLYIAGALADRPDTNSLVPVGWFRIAKNVANTAIGVIFIDTLFGLSSLIARVVSFDPVQLGN